MTFEEAQALVNTFTRWHQTFEIYPGLRTPGSYNSDALLKRLAIPADLAGKRVLDIGANDGYYSCELARRGADVTAFDYQSKEAMHNGFAITERLFGVSVPHINDNVLNLPKYDLGTFDMVLFLGVLYHLPDPLITLASMHTLLKDGGLLYVESEILGRDAGQDDQLVMRYYPGETLNRDITNFWVPSVGCLRAMIEDFGYHVIRGEDSEGTGHRRYFAVCQRITNAQSEQRKRVAYGRWGD